MSLWKEHFHWSVLLRWEIVGWTIATLLAIGGIVLVFDQFWGANICFMLVALIIFAKVAHVAIVASDPAWQRLLFTFLLFGVVGVGIVETVRSVNQWSARKRLASETTKPNNGSPATSLSQNGGSEIRAAETPRPGDGRIDKKSRDIASDNPKPDSLVITRLVQLRDEGTEMQRTCQSIPNAYQTPPEQRADLANSIVRWQQRVEGALSLDSDTYVNKIWQKAILYGDPKTPPSIAIHCTVLGVKMTALDNILNRKRSTTRQVRARLQTFIDEGESLKLFCIESDDEKAILEQEANWTTKVYDWIGLYLDDSYKNDFDGSGSSATRPNQQPKTNLGLAVWHRTKARVDTLHRFLKELSAAS
jgi:hypothetical protein